LHLEVFSGDDLPGFIERSRSYAETLPEGSGSLLVIEAGATLVEPPPPDLSLASGERIRVEGEPASGRFARLSRLTLQIAERRTLGDFSSSTNSYSSGAVWTGWYVGVNDGQRTQNQAESDRGGYTRREVLVPAGEPLWVERASLPAGNAEVGAEPLAAWSQFPLQLEGTVEVALTRVVPRAQLEQAPAGDAAVDPEGNSWWRVHIMANSGEQGRVRSTAAWACEKDHAKVSWQSPWAWPRFELVEEGELENVDMLSSHYHRSERAES